MTILTMAVLVANCANATKHMTPTISFHPTPLMLPIPADVQRGAVLYPRDAHPDWSSTYGRLEGAAFQLKTFCPNLRIIDRSHMRASSRSSDFRSGGLFLKTVPSESDKCWA
jgi:hypothetical protein